MQTHFKCFLTICINDKRYVCFQLYCKPVCVGFSQSLLYCVYAGRYSSVGSDVTWESRGTAIDPRILQIFLRRLGYENISTAILSLPLIQEEYLNLSVSGKRMCAKYW